MAGLDEAFIIAEGIATAAQLDAAEVVVMAVEGAVKLAQWVELTVNATTNVGVAYQSGSGDYAEYLERLQADEQIEAGDIVGVYGGKITRSTANAQQLMAISSAPIVLGNMPEEGQEHLYEKVAFLGQILIKVLGPVQQGDYIIPSGLEDGSGIAVAPEMMTADEFTKVVGRAWSASNETGLKLINVAIGLNTGDVAMLVHKQEAELAVFKAALAQQDKEMRTLRAEVNDLQAVTRDVQRLNAAMAKLVASASEAAPRARGMTVAAGDRN